MQKENKTNTDNPVRKARQKELKLWNGRAIAVLNRHEQSQKSHIFIAAYSVADARRVCVEAGRKDPGAYEINNYWHHGTWGNLMEGVSVERGLWVVRDRHHGSKPERLLAKDEN